METTDFSTPTLHEDFTNIDLQYRLYNGILQVVGSFNRVLDSVNTIVFNLPENCRPEIETRILAYNEGNGFMRSYIQTDGDVIILDSLSPYGVHHISCYIPINNNNNHLNTQQMPETRIETTNGELELAGQTGVRVTTGQNLNVEFSDLLRVLTGGLEVNANALIDGGNLELREGNLSLNDNTINFQGNNSIWASNEISLTVQGGSFLNLNTTGAGGIAINSHNGNSQIDFYSPIGTNLNVNGMLTVGDNLGGAPTPGAIRYNEEESRHEGFNGAWHPMY